MEWLKAVRQTLALPSARQLDRANESLTREVLERSRAVEELAQEREFTEFLVNSISDCVATLDRDLVVRLWNRAMAEQTGHPASAVVGRPMFDVNPLLRGTVFEEAMRTALAGREHVLEDQLVAEGMPSAGRWVYTRYSPLRGGDGEVIGCIVFLRDVTERHRMEEALRQAQKMEALGQLTGGIAHDFNNFLTAVIGNLDLMGLRLRNAAPEIERLRDSALQGALRAATLTRQLLAFSRRQVLSPRAVDVNSLVARMSELLRRTLGEAVVTETALADGLWPAYADPNQLESALLNLALNARDAMPDGGRLSITTANAYLDEAATRNTDGVEPGHFVLVTVTDTGSGMTDDVRERAFDPFFTTKTVGKGSGLGLSQVYGFVKQSGGQVQIESRVGAGTTVKLYLPRRGEAAVEQETDGMPLGTTGPVAKPGERVLVVEDEALVRNFAVDALRELGYTVVSAADSIEALARLEEPAEFDLLLTDLGLPGLNGRQLAEAALQRWPKLRILYVSGYGQNAIIASGGELEADLLSKPFESRALAAAVRAAIDRGAIEG
jgi:PAS domain S-box-containing protein